MTPNRIYKPGSGATASGAGHPGTGEGEEKIPPFPLEQLPPAARAMAEAIARTERTPETLAGCCVLGALSASIGAGLQIKSGPNRLTPANLYIMATAQSGCGKSETYRHAIKPLGDFEQELIERWKVETKPGLEAELAILEGELAKLKKTVMADGQSVTEREKTRTELQHKLKNLEEVKQKLHAPRLYCEDVTSEKLSVMLANNQEQLGSLSSDAGNIVNILLGRYNKLDRTDEGVYLKSFSREPSRTDRQSREPILLQRPCLAALWLVQPDKLETLLAKTELTDGGLLPRILACHSNAQPLPIVEAAEGIPQNVGTAWARLVRVLISTYRLRDAPVTIEPTPEALQMLNDHHNRIVKRRLTDLKDVTVYAARWNEQAWRISVCLHAGKHGECVGDRKLEADTAASAIALADWFAGEQLQILEGGRTAARRAKRDKVLELLTDTPTGITARDILRSRTVANADEARMLLAQMESDGEITHREYTPEGGGHIMSIYTKIRK